MNAKQELINDIRQDIQRFESEYYKIYDSYNPDFARLRKLAVLISNRATEARVLEDQLLDEYYDG